MTLPFLNVVETKARNKPTWGCVETPRWLYKTLQGFHRASWQVAIEPKERALLNPKRGFYRTPPGFYRTAHKGSMEPPGRVL